MHHEMFRELQKKYQPYNNNFNHLKFQLKVVILDKNNIYYNQLHVDQKKIYNL